MRLPGCKNASGAVRPSVQLPVDVCGPSLHVAHAALPIGSVLRVDERGRRADVGGSRRRGRICCSTRSGSAFLFPGRWHEPHGHGHHPRRGSRRAVRPSKRCAASEHCERCTYGRFEAAAASPATASVGTHRARSQRPFLRGRRPLPSQERFRRQSRTRRVVATGPTPCRRGPTTVGTPPIDYVMYETCMDSDTPRQH